MTPNNVKQAYELGYNDVLESLHLKEAGFFMNMAGKARDLGSRMMGASKGHVQANRAAINEGRAAVQGAKETSQLAATKGKYEQKVNDIQGKTPGGAPTPPPAAGAAPAPTPPPAAGAAPAPGAEGAEGAAPGVVDKAKGWWGQRSPWAKAGIGAAVGLPIAGGLYAAGGMNPPRPQQQPPQQY
jgi:hypothetical protein